MTPVVAPAEPTTGTDTIEELLSTLAPPCDCPVHAKGVAGCHPEDPAHWLALVEHFPHPAPGGPACDSRVLAWCDGHTAHMQAEAAAGTGVLCRVCGSIGYVRDWFTIIGEV